MKSSKCTIELLKRIIRDKNCQGHMNLSTVKGYLGELLVKNRLEHEGLIVQHHGNQSGFDLQCEYRGETFKLDVKFSMPKYEYDSSHVNWGWALVHQHKQRNLSCTHMVCVAVDENLNVHKVYVIPVANIQDFPPSVGKFSRIKHGFALF